MSVEQIRSQQNVSNSRGSLIPATSTGHNENSRTYGPGRRAVIFGIAGAGIAAIAATSPERARAVNAPSTGKTQTVTARPVARDVGDERTYQALSASDLNPTGFYLPPDKKLTVSVAKASADEHILVVGAPDAETDKDKQKVREYPLEVGENEVEDPYGGPLYWKVLGDKGYLKATLDAPARRMPFFIHGTTTESEFQDQLDERDTPYAEYISSHAMVTVQIEAARRFRGENHVELMSTFEDIVAAEDAFAGLDDKIARDARLDYRYHFITRAESIEGVGAYATHGHMLFPSPIQDRLLTVDALRMRGWGVYHELGHQHQQTAYKPTSLTETTVNWYALAVNRKFGTLYGQAPRLHVVEDSTGESVWTSAPPKIGSKGVAFTDTFSQMEQLVMFEQLRLVYGDSMYQDLHKLVRKEKPETGDYEDEEYRISMLVYYLSKAAGEDLRDFAEAWGLSWSKSIDKEISKLKLPQPEEDLTDVRDDDGEAAMAHVLSSKKLMKANDIPR